MNPSNRFHGVLRCLVLAMFTLGCTFVGRAAGASLHIYDLSTGQEVKALSGHNRPTTAIAVSPDGALALTASLTPELRLWSLQEGREIRSLSQSRLPGYAGAGASLQFINGTNLVLIGREHAGVHLWDLTSNAPVSGFKAQFIGLSSALVSTDQKTVLALSGSDVTVAAWGFAKGDSLGVFSEHWMNGFRYVSLTRDGKPRSWWQSDTGEPWPQGRPTPLGSQPGFGDRALLSPDGKKLASLGTSMTAQNARWLHLWDIETGKLLWHHPALDLRMASRVQSISFSPDSTTFALGSHGGGLALREVEGGRLRQELKTPVGACAHILFLPEGKQLLTWGDKTMRVWDLGTGKMVRAFGVPTVHCLALTPDGRFVLAGGDGEFRGL